MCQSVADYRSGTWSNESYAEVTLSPMYSNNPEDNQFSKATPSGSLKMIVTTEVGKAYFTPGKYYYLDFTEAEA